MILDNNAEIEVLETRAVFQHIFNFDIDLETCNYETTYFLKGSALLLRQTCSFSSIKRHECCWRLISELWKLKISCQLKDANSQVRQYHNCLSIFLKFTMGCSTVLFLSFAVLFLFASFASQAQLEVQKVL